MKRFAMILMVVAAVLCLLCVGCDDDGGQNGGGGSTGPDGPAVVPVPGAALLVGVGLALVARFRRRF